MILDHDLFLDVPFSDKENAKSLGVKPFFENKKFKCWYVEKGLDVSLYERWWPADFRQSVSPALAHEDIKSFSLSQVMASLTRAISIAAPDALWIKAEVTGVTGVAHKYLELVDYESASTGNPVKSRGVIFSGASRVLTKFEEETGMKLAPGMKILFKAYVEFSGQFGLSLRIVDLNSEFVLGQAELNLQAIRNDLTQQGIINNNKKFSQPQEFTRIALIAPQGAAGLGDFMTQAKVLEDHKLCKFDLFTATFQGNSSVDSFINAFADIMESMNDRRELYDAIVIIRGGGDKAGLYALNQYPIAEAVCLMPVPVIVGIGHERDNTILDELACQRFPTPSMVISHITGTIIGNMEEMLKLEQSILKLAHEKCQVARMQVERNESSMIEASLSILSNAKREVDRLDNQLFETSRVVIEKAKNEINTLNSQIFESSKFQIEKAKNEVRLLTQQIIFNNPAKILDRGYAIVKDGSGTTVGDGYKVSEPGSSLTIRFRDTTITATTN